MPASHHDDENNLADAREVLAKLASGDLSVDKAMLQLGIAKTTTASERQSADPEEKLETATFESALAESAKAEIDGATVDLGRSTRCGFAEVIYGEGKSADLISRIITTQRNAGQRSLVTRIAPEVAKRVVIDFPPARHNTLARTLSLIEDSNATPDSIAVCEDASVYHVAVVTAGSTDAPVAHEAMETLHWMNIPFRSFTDIGVAGPQRLLDSVEQLRQAKAVIVIAGMEGALPAAIGGHVSAPVIAVPTSVGYGATLGGLTPMLGMLSSCASNVAVVNIDAGFKGAYLAGLIVRQLNEAMKQ